MAQRTARQQRAFALPTVLIASVILLSVLSLAVTATTAVRNTLKNQYYSQLAKIAGEAGVAAAQACLQQSNNVVTWSNAKPLTPGTDCNGNMNIQSTVKALVVGGGGGGGTNGGGGGGAGGYRYSEGVTVAAQAYPVVVGAAGAAGSSSTVAGTSGSASSFNGISASGGGGGASRTTTAALAGGSGGGGGGANTATAHVAGTGVAGQGNSGGGGTPSDLGCNAAGGGGGGAGGAGGVGASQLGGNGGIGIANTVSGTSVYYSVGGIGGITCNGSRGTVATGGIVAGQAITPNRGLGGLGGSGSSLQPSTAGSSGVVIISYPENSGITATGGTQTVVAGMRIHTFTSNGTFNVTADNASCPGSTRCYVTYDGNVRSSYSIGDITLDGSGRPVAIPQTGYVELIRQSTGSVWRTYRQPGVQPAVVPELCSGAARSDLGWSNAVLLSSGSAGIALPAGTTAKPISISAGSALPGSMYYRKDFSVTEAGTYTLQTRADDGLRVYVDGALVNQVYSSAATQSVDVDLQPGCHVIQASVVNWNVSANPTGITASLRKQGASREIVVTDTSWRVTAAEPVHFSDVRYYQDPSWWADARSVAAYNASPWGIPNNWANYSNNNVNARWASGNSSYSGVNYPAPGFSYFRTKRQAAWTVTQPTEVALALACDNNCKLYLDGSEIIRKDSERWDETSSIRITLSPGSHMIGLELQNTTTTANPAAFLFAAYRTSDGALVDQSDTGWVNTKSWWSTAQDLRSYNETYRPNPDVFNCNCVAQGATNIITNPSAETGVDTYTPVRATITRTTAAARQGSYGVRATVNEVGAMPRIVAVQPDPPEIGQVYTISAYVRASVGTQVAYQFLDQFGYAIYVNGVAAFYGAVTNPAGGWNRASVTTIPVPAGTTVIHVWAGVAANTPVNTVFDVDGIMMTPGPTLYEYADGASVGWRWLGAPQGSASSGPVL